MRKCIRCGSEMKEDCAVKIEGAGYGIILSSDESKLFGGRIGKPKLPSAPNVEKFLSIWRMSASWARQVKMYPCIWRCGHGRTNRKNNSIEKVL